MRRATATTATSPRTAASYSNVATTATTAGGHHVQRARAAVAVLRCLVAALVVTILLAGLAALIFWLVVRPKSIDYTVTGAVVRHFNLAVEDAPAPFRQPHRDETRLEVRAVARSVPVGEQTARELRHDLAAGQVGVDVRMRARVQFKVAGVRSRRYDLQAFCSPVVIGLAPSSARSFESVPCDVAIS
ncbi:unnamed protein product [Miscanthus lutarioriparius]|uniref:Late embryogenesis abundant protein LEA-2 subgroup domain-containing protein n=1 Tax=Miscanthus lutarioriparius TaxID=422564 RepID=A0A811MGX2_9POAL|nr:unnamed protein product [Miscanthus lutarioriparius]